MKALLVHRDPELASSRVRMLSLVPHLEERGIACESLRHPRGLFSARALERETAPDVIVVQKKLPSVGDAWAWGRRRVPLVFDYDDAIMYRQKPRNGRYESRTRRRRFERMLQLADAFVCGNEYLASFCRTTGKPVLVAPSAVPLDVPTAGPRDLGRPARVGWLGSPGNLPSVASLGSALRRVGERCDFVLVVISEAPLSLDGVRTEHVPWSLASQEADLASLDVAVMPLDDSPWSRGKCAYKLLQYMAASLPVVASPVGMNTEVVRAGENGLLARAEVEWSEALIALLEDPRRAAELGAAGNRTVRAEFGYPEVADAWASFLADLVTP